MCETCRGHGLWGFGDPSPMDSMDAANGSPTTKCPECGANDNPIDIYPSDTFTFTRAANKVIEQTNPMIKPATQDKFILCDCNCDALLLSKDEDESMLYISLWSRGRVANRLPFWDRVKWACRMIWDGNPFGDEVVLDKSKVIELKKWLSDAFNLTHEGR